MVKLAAVVMCAAAGLLGCTGGRSSGPPRTSPAAGAARAPAEGEGGPILVELFTSQGCSSCPPADHLLSLLGADPAMAGQIIPLAYHVDYWNYIGWQDPFSQAAWTQRQHAYAAAFAERRIYTPQLVVNGEAHVVGNDRDASFQLMDQTASHGRRARVTVTKQPLKMGRVNVIVEVVTEAGSPALDVMIALAQDGIETKVLRGENQGEKLTNDHIVRRLERAGQVGAGAQSQSFNFAFDPEPAWGPGPLHFVAFVQEPKTLRVHGVAQIAW